MTFSSVPSKSVRPVDGSNFTFTFVIHKIVLKICEHLLNPNENNDQFIGLAPFADNGVAMTLVQLNTLVSRITTKKFLTQPLSGWLNK